MAADMSPPARVRAALPGTLAELTARTGYPPEQVLKFITRLRVDGLAVRAVMGQRSLEGIEPTVYTTVPESTDGSAIGLTDVAREDKVPG